MEISAKLLVLTDLHLRERGETIIGLDPAARLRAVLDHALDHHGDADAMVLTGDLTHTGKGAEYAVLRHMLAEVPLPVLPMIGNHDRRAVFCAAFPDAPLSDGGFVQQIRDLDGHRIITLDSNDGPFGHHAGRLCDQRMAYLRHALEEAGGRVPLVFIHHPPMDVGLPGMDAIKLENGAEMLALLAAHPKAALFCGHVHRTISGSAGGVPFTLFKSPCHQAPLDLETADSSLSIDEPGAYGLLLLTPEGVVAHSQDV